VACNFTVATKMERSRSHAKQPVKITEAMRDKNMITADN